MKIKKNHIILIIIIISVCNSINLLYSQNVGSLNQKAMQYYSQKQYDKAIGAWLDILNIDPDNQRAMLKIEEVYEINQRKDLSFQKSKRDYKISKYKLKAKDDEDLEAGIAVGWNAIRDYSTAYRLDPLDEEVRLMKEKMRQLEKDLRSAEEKLRLSRAIRDRIKLLREKADEEMDNEKYPKALNHWNEILGYVPKDGEANEGKRTCLLAIENRLKFERIQSLIGNGKNLFDNKKYKLSRIQFVQVLKVDDRNRDAKDYIEEIDEILEEKQLFEIRRQQAESLYQSGVRNLQANKFEQAQNDLEAVLVTIKDYKDTEQKLASIERLRKEYQFRENQKKLQEIDKFFQDGMMAFNEGKYKFAVSKFDQTLALDPKNLYAKRYLDRARTALKQREEEVVDENSPYYEIVYSLILSGKELYKKGKFIQSRKKFNRILRLFPKNRIAREFDLKCYYRMNPLKLKSFSQNLFAMGQQLLRKNKHDDAMKKFQLLRSLRPDYPGIDNYITRAKGQKKYFRENPVGPVGRGEINRRYRAAMAFYQRGGKDNIEKALAGFRWIVKNDPNNVKAVINVNKIEAQLRISVGQKIADRKGLTPQLKRKVQRHYYKGIGYYSNNNFRKAIAEWRKVLIIDPGNLKARNNIRKCLAFLGR